MKRFNAKGLTLLELLISMVIGVLLIGGTINLFVGTQQTNRTQEAMSRVQESGRLAQELVARAVREAGQRGCPSQLVNNLLDPNHADYDPDAHGITQPFSNVAAPAEHLRGDVLAINRARRSDVNLTASGSGSGSGGQIPPIGLVQNASGIPMGTRIMVVSADGMSCDLFANGVNQNSNNLQRADSRNISISESRGMFSEFVGPIEVFEVGQDIFYIRNNDNGIASLYRNNDELIEGIYDMRLEYGRDTTRNGVVDVYTDHGSMAAADWAQVIAVRMHLIAYSGLEGNVIETPQTLLFSGANTAMPDNRLYQVFTTTIAVRNLVR